MSRSAAGVKGISLRAGDEVSSFDIIPEGEKSAMFLNVLENGFAKQTHLKEYKVQTRGGKGILTAVVTAKTGELVSSKVITDETELVAISVKGQILKTSMESVRTTSRAAQGVRLINLSSGDKIAGVICL
jgi:DNA gyrase subunit A